MALIEAAIFFNATGKSYGITEEDFNGNLIVGSGITFDLLLDEVHNRASTVTDRPVEDGSIISDHIWNNPENGVITGFITNFSIYKRGLTSNRAQDAFNTLEDLWKKKVLITLVTVLKTYESVAITSFTVQRNADTGEALGANIAFRKVNKVRLKTVQLFATVNTGGIDTNPAKQASNKANLGRQVGTPQ